MHALTSRTFSPLHVTPVLAADRTHGLVEELVRPFYAPRLGSTCSRAVQNVSPTSPGSKAKPENYELVW
jgi:hypothetical protein